MKAFTDVSQSKKLAEFLPLESADMRFEYILPRKSDKILHYPTVGNPIETLEMFNKGYTILGSKPLSLDEYCIPCWSLAALMDVYPMVVGRDMDMYCCWQNHKNLHSRHYDNPVDACYEMILKLHEQKLL